MNRRTFNRSPGDIAVVTRCMGFPKMNKTEHSLEKSEENTGDSCRDTPRNECGCFEGGTINM